MGIPQQGLNIGNMIKGGMEMGKAVNGRYISIKKMISVMSFLHTQAIEAHWNTKKDSYQINARLS